MSNRTPRANESLKQFRTIIALLAVLLPMLGFSQWQAYAAAHSVPPVVEDQTFSVFENSASGTVVGTVAATNALTYTILSGNELGAFAINSSTGLLTVADGTQINYEVIPTFSLTVEVANDEGTDTGIMAINVVDVNDAPAADDQGFTVLENSPDGTSLGNVIASDEDGDSLSYALLLGNTGNTFALETTTGELTVANNTVLDYETNPNFTLLVSINDGGLSDTALVRIKVSDVNESAPEINPQTFSIAEDVANGTLVGTVVVTDSDGIDPLTFAIFGGDPNGVFAINEDGQISIANNSTLDYETTPAYSLDVRVTDSGNLTDTAVITINVTEVTIEKLSPIYLPIVMK